MPEELTPITREETYLAAIAGEDVTPPDPVIRKEEFLAAIDGHVGDVESAVGEVESAVVDLESAVTNLESAGEALASVVQDLWNIVPAPAAADSGKVLTAGADGTASWETGGSSGALSGMYLQEIMNSFYLDRAGTILPAAAPGLARLRNDYAAGVSAMEIARRCRANSMMGSMVVYSTTSSTTAITLIETGFITLPVNGTATPLKMRRQVPIYLNVNSAVDVPAIVFQKFSDNSVVSASDIDFTGYSMTYLVNLVYYQTA